MNKNGEAAARIQKLEHFLNRELRGSTLANYAIKADVRAYKKAEKMNKKDDTHTEVFNKQLQNEFHMAKLNIENVQMTYARKLHRLKADQMRVTNEKEVTERELTHVGPDDENFFKHPYSRRGVSRATTIASSRQIANSDLRNIIRASTSHNPAKHETESKTEMSEKEKRAATAAGTTKAQFLKNVKAQDVFMAKLSSLLKPAEREKPPEKEPEPTRTDIDDSRRLKSRFTASRIPHLNLDGGSAAREFQKYPDCPVETNPQRENKLLSSEKDDTMYSWLGFENQEQFDRLRGLNKFRAAAKRVTMKEFQEMV